MSEVVEVRCFRARDLAGVERVMEEFFPSVKPNRFLGLYHYIFRRFFEWVKWFVVERKLSWGCVPRCFVAVISGRVVGVADLYYVGRGCWELGFLGVCRDWRGRGAGTKLLLACVCFVRERGGKVLGLTAGPGNVEAKRLYRRIGFVSTEVLERMELRF